MFKGYSQIIGLQIYKSIIFVYKSNIGAKMTENFSSIALRVLQVAWTRLGSWWSYANLSAPYWRFYWNDLPGASIMLQGRRIRLEPDKAYLLKPDTAFASFPPQSPKKPAHFYIHFTVESDSFEVADPLYVFPAGDDLKSRIRQIMELCDRGETFKADMTALGLLGGFIASLPVRLPRGNCEPRTMKAFEILNNHCERGISNPELAAKFSMSTNSFLRFFRQSAGTSPQKYLNQIRVERACFMLHCTEKSIKEIADSLGFCDRYHFTKAFSKIRGESPARFRKKIYSNSEK